MFVVGLLSWWYGAGWRRQFVLLRERIESTYDYFSIDLLVKTVFAPYRQISAGSIDGPIGLKFRAFVDRLISRCIGAVLRIFMMLFGIVTILLTVVFGLVLVIGWAFLPLLPVIGAVLTAIGWVPTWM